jgi:DNA repair protein SbcD/Mre11
MVRMTSLSNKHRQTYNHQMAAGIRILLLADSHLGFDLPMKPRSGRRRRGYDFLANYAAALAPALAAEVDVVVHAGDVFDRSSVLSSVAYQAYEPLRRIASLGIPVLIVPGNHERSRLPHAHLVSHHDVHVFDRPRTFAVNVRGATLALSGFPYERDGVRVRFPELVEQTGWGNTSAHHRVLCIHHCVEGATVGPGNFTFTTADDVIRAQDMPHGFAAVLSGHIHRHQVLRLRAPVLYPGSIERTSFAEIDEPKGFMIVHIAESEGDREVHWEFRPLPARPMILEDVDVATMNARALEAAIHTAICAAPPDAVLSIRLAGEMTDAHWRVVSSARIQALAPATMNVDVSPRGGFSAPRYARARIGAEAPTAQLSFC